MKKESTSILLRLALKASQQNMVADLHPLLSFVTRPLGTIRRWVSGFTIEDCSSAL